IGTGRSLNNYSIPAQKAGKTGTTNDYTDGWFIGYTPELLAGTWVGCEDPFLPIYQNNSGGAEMSAPRWGIFMSKVYADSKLDYGKVKAFDKPAALASDPIYVDANFGKIATSGDSLDVNTNGNGDANEFITEDPNKNDENEKDPKKNPADTGKGKQNMVKPKPKSN